MQIVNIIDERGWKRRFLVSEEVDIDDAQEIGLDIGVPDIGVLDWDELAKELNNKLFDSGLFTWDDIRANETGLTPILRSVFLERLIHLYK